MSFCGVKTQINKPVCVLIFQKYKGRYSKHFSTRNNISYKSNSLCPLNIHQILFFLQSMAIKSDLTVEMGFSYLKHGKSGITRDSRHNRYMRFSFYGGGHIRLFVNRPPGGHLNLFPMFFWKFYNYTDHHTKFQKLVTNCTILPSCMFLPC